MYILIFIIIIILIIFLYRLEEQFTPLPHEEDLPNEYRFINFPLIKTPKNQIQLNNRIWEKRFPSLVPQRYSFNDIRNPCQNYTDINDFARLKELSIGFNPYFVTEQKIRFKNRELLKINSFDYGNFHQVAFNAGPGTSDSFYLTDKGF